MHSMECEAIINIVPKFGFDLNPISHDEIYTLANGSLRLYMCTSSFAGIKFTKVKCVCKSEGEALLEHVLYVSLEPDIWFWDVVSRRFYIIRIPICYMFIM